MEHSAIPSSFFELLQESDKPVLVDFYADWCGPCKMVSPAVARIAREMRSQLLTVKIDVDRKPHIASHYQISSIPTIMLFRNGKVLMRIQGAQPYEQIAAEVRKALG